MICYKKLVMGGRTELAMIVLIRIYFFMNKESKHHDDNYDVPSDYYHNFSIRIQLTTGNLVLVGWATTIVLLVCCTLLKRR